MTALMILVAGPYRSGTNDDPALIAKNVEAITRSLGKPVYFSQGDVPRA
jgi:hypothetical protein